MASDISCPDSPPLADLEICLDDPTENSSILDTVENQQGNVPKRLFVKLRQLSTMPEFQDFSRQINEIADCLTVSFSGALHTDILPSKSSQKGLEGMWNSLSDLISSPNVFRLSYFISFAEFIYGTSFQPKCVTAKKSRNRRKLNDSDRINKKHKRRKIGRSKPQKHSEIADLKHKTATSFYGLFNVNTNLINVSGGNKNSNFATNIAPGSNQIIQNLMIGPIYIKMA